MEKRWYVLLISAYWQRPSTEQPCPTSRYHIRSWEPKTPYLQAGLKVWFQHADVLNDNTWHQFERGGAQLRIRGYMYAPYPGVTCAYSKLAGLHNCCTPHADVTVMFS